MDTKKTPIIIVGVVAVIAVIAVIAFVLGRGTNVDDQAASPVVSSETTTLTSEDSGRPIDQVNTSINHPGALLGNTQRTWPQRYEDSPFNDSTHANPGTYSVDWAWQRPVWTPINHDGDFPDQVQSGGWEQCENPEEIRLEGKTQQQYVNARYLVVNEFVGPTRLERGVPRGYAHSPQGAVVSAMNLMGYGMYDQGDEIGEEVDKALWSTSEIVKDLKKDRGEPEISILAGSRAAMIPGANAFRIKTCSENVMVIDVIHIANANREENSESTYITSTVPLIWKAGEWSPNMGGGADKRLNIEGHSSDNLIEVTYS